MARRLLCTVARAQRSQRGGVTIVHDRVSAERALERLYQYRGRMFACDTEVAGLDLKKESPIGHGFVTCASIYCGHDVDFGSGPALWIDNLDEADGTLMLFKEFFEDSSCLKVWHNYSFDRHVLYNHGINCQGLGGDTMHMARLWDSARKGRGGYSLEGLTGELIDNDKRTMKQRFGRAKQLKDGSEGKMIETPDVLTLQRDGQYRCEWIEYSTEDAVLTYDLYHCIREKLEQMQWGCSSTNLMQFYDKYYRPFGELLTDMERTGVYVDNSYLKRIEQEAELDAEKCKATFLEWAKTVSPDAALMNIKSGAQKQQLFFAPKSPSEKGIGGLEHERVFHCENVDDYIEPGKTKPLKKRPFVLYGLGLPVEKRTPSGKPAADAAIIRGLAGPNPSKGLFGPAKAFFGDGKKGEHACLAMDTLLQHGSIETLLDTFIRPLQTYADENGRVHCSLNLNTETGRLSSRKPNLQNQPALEKDIYKIRGAFSAPPGRKLVVADYAQLELRILAHLTKCDAMVDAFSSGGDLHSRTAHGMFDYIQEDVNNGAILVEWDEKKEKRPPPVPLLKDKYASERRKAKMLNFSIAYGKTVKGLASDWGVSVAEAESTLQKWYDSRPEVLRWQETMKNDARKTGLCRTMMGRYRQLPHINSSNPSLRNHSERCAINTPIQGSAADVVMKAMIEIHRNERLREMGWSLLLQVHDEVMLEGPEESAEEALELVKQLMMHPFSKPLLVTLDVSGSFGDNWFETK